MTSYDVLVIGGGPAGLAAATTLARARLDVLVVDAGQPRNAAAEGVHSFLSRDGMPPAELLSIGRAELASYGGQVVDGDAVAASTTDDGFTVRLADGATYAGRRLLVASGATDELPDVPGLAERWGTSVVHCPFCHGAEVAGRPIAVLATNPLAVQHQALLWSQWTDDLTLLLHEQEPPEGETAELLDARGVRVVPGRVERVVSTDGRLTGVEVAGSLVPAEAVVVGSFVRARSALLEQLGAEPVGLEMAGTTVATYLPSEQPTGLTSVRGVYVAGNVAAPMAQVVSSAASGVFAAGAIVMDLVTADARSRAA